MHESDVTQDLTRGGHPVEPTVLGFAATGALLTVEGTAKRYGSTRALRDVSLTIEAGKIHALLGENGAGKSTLVKIILGAVQPDAGRISFQGRTVACRSVRDALSLGIFPIYQHLSQFPHLTVRENLAAFEIGGSSVGLTVRVLPDDTMAQSWLEEVGLNVALSETVGNLSVGERQLLEIARSVSRDVRVLVLDEPTAALNQVESDRLFAVVRKLCARGCGVLLISHKLEEVERYADTVTVIRDGVCAIAGVPTSQVDQSAIVMAMLGDDARIALTPGAPGERSVFEARNIRIKSDCAPMSIAVSAGEIVGLVGIVGSGVDKLAAVLGGALAAPGADITVAGTRIRTGNRGQAVKAGIGYVPPDRHAEGLFDAVSALGNASASRLPAFSHGGFLNKAAERSGLVPLLKRLNLTPFAIDAAASAFSGGNQQKLVVARNLALDPLNLLVLSEPTRGVDIGARGAIHQAIVDVAAGGAGVVVATSDVDELIALAHRIIVVRENQISGEVARGTSREALVSMLVQAEAA